ncbi:MAG: squalene--hopene cyclase [Chloroflexi bacterium]|nr:squalene--hopene cyclase [Chloroflexota bacterium]
MTSILESPGSVIPPVRVGMPRPSPAKAENGATPESGLGAAISRTQEFLFNHQADEGYWWGELESNPTMEAEYVFLTHFLGMRSEERLRKIKNFIVRRQGDDGGWNLYYGAASDLSTSCECYLALKLAGVPAESDEMLRARQFILSRGGVEKCRVFTKIWFALLGEWDWGGVPFLPPEMMLLPNRIPFNIYQFAMWSRATIVPMSVLLSSKPIHPVPESATVDELFVNGRENADYSMPKPEGLSIERLMFAGDKLLRLSNLLPWNPARARALRVAETWIVDHQEADGSWGGIQPPWAYSLMALHELGYANDHEVIRKGMEGFDLYAIEDEDTWRLQPSMSPLWDTCLSITALIDSGVDPDDPRLVKASDYLIERQIASPGDWQKKAGNVEPGGWAFEFHNETYPDTDDAAEVLLAIGIAGASDMKRRAEAVEKGVNWIMAMQSRNGGWGAYDKDNTSTLVTKMPFFDFGETIDPPSVDVTAHILEMLAKLGFPTNTEPVKKALDYMLSEQEDDGAWFGRWGVNYVYGTASVLPALEAMDFPMDDLRIVKAANWLEAQQNDDGGWGESCASYANPAWRGRGVSTPSQTAWALLGLISAGRADGDPAKKGVEYLIGTQLGDGSWDEDEYTGTGFPGYGNGDRKFTSLKANERDLISEHLPAGFMIKYHMYRIYWPLMALGRYRERLSRSA